MEISNQKDKKKLLQTYSGILIDPFDPNPEDIIIEDIAHALSNLCRFGGHVREFYSVAEHSYRGSFLCLGDELSFLLHDASEAYMVDIPRPIKYRLAGYKEAEENLQKIIFDKFNLPFPFSQKVKEIDDLMLQKESAYILNFPKDPSLYIKPLTPIEAKELFLERFIELYSKNINTHTN